MAYETNGWNGNGNGPILFTNVRVLDATGEYPFTGEVLVQGNRVKQVSRGSSRVGSSPVQGGATVIDGMGATLMPGLIDAHLHLSWNNAPGIDPIQMMELEEHMLVTMEMAKLVLDAGFTAGRGAAAAKPRLDVVAKRFINEGRFPGPRYLAAGPEITTVGGLGDSAPSHIPHEGLNLGIVVSGPEEVRRTVRQLIKYGVDSIKLNLSGEEITGMGAEETPMSEEEVAMAVKEAKCRNKVLAAHARSSGSVKQCVRHGIQNIYHASFADEEALDMLEANKDKHFVAPGIAWLINTARHAEPWGIKPGSKMATLYERELEMCVETMKKMHRRGIRICVGGDYGFAWTPQGTNAKDIQTFVEMLGFTPMEAIQAATKFGGEIMGMERELGLLREGYLADLLLVDGDPDRRRPHPARSDPHPCHYERWQVPQGAAHEPAAPATDGMSIVEQAVPGLTGRHARVLVWALVAALVAWLFFAVWPSWLDAVLISKKAFINSIFNGVTLAGLYFLVASGFTLVFGLMRNVNLAHGSLYLLGAYIGYEVAQRTGIWLLGVGAGSAAIAVVGLLMQVVIFRRLEGDELRQTLVTLGISIVAADLMLAIWTGITYQIGIPSWLDGAVKLPIITTVRANGTAVMMTYPFYRLVVLAVAIVVGVGLWLMINRTRIGTMIRAGVDDRSMLSASGINVQMVFAIVFAVGAGLAGFAGVVGGSALSIAPGEDVRYLLASLVVVIVGGMGSITGAAIGALLVGLAEQIGLVYLPTYGIVLTFIIMVVTLAFRPQGIMGKALPSGAPILALDQPNKAVVASARLGPVHIALATALILYPAIASEFFLTQIGAYSLIWGLLALSMMLLAGYGGMVCLAQITTAGVAAYTVAIFGTNNMNIYGFGWPWWVLVPFAVLLAATVSAIIGAISVRTEGIYTIMITLAIAAAFFYFAQQNYGLLNGHSGYAGIPTPHFWGINWSNPLPFYYLCLFVASAAYAAVLYCSRSTFGLALQAIRDNGRRMRAVGFDITAHKVVAYFYSGIIAGLAGVLLAWFNGRVSPGTVGVFQAVNVLVIAVIGGLHHPIGPFLGAVFVVLIQTFAIDIVGAERYNTLIGLVFLAIVFVSPDGLLGLWGRIKPLLAQDSVRSRLAAGATLRAET